MDDFEVFDLTVLDGLEDLTFLDGLEDLTFLDGLEDLTFLDGLEDLDCFEDFDLGFFFDAVSVVFLFFFWFF